jgi:hypothetical protein
LKDKMDFRSFQYIGLNNEEFPRWRVNHIPDIISVLDWCRSNIKDDTIGRGCTDQIVQIQIELARGRLWEVVQDYTGRIRLHTTYVYWSDETGREV